MQSLITPWVVSTEPTVRFGAAAEKAASAAGSAQT